jgi:hypothetical protein
VSETYLDNLVELRRMRGIFRRWPYDGAAGGKAPEVLPRGHGGGQAHLRWCGSRMKIVLVDCG